MKVLKTCVAARTIFEFFLLGSHPTIQANNKATNSSKLRCTQDNKQNKKRLTVISYLVNTERIRASMTFPEIKHTGPLLVCLWFFFFLCIGFFNTILFLAKVEFSLQSLSYK